MTSKMGVPRINPVNSFYDKYMFIIVFIMGSIGMIALKTFQIPQLYVTIWPVFLMITYAFFLAHVQQPTLGENQSGDNLYYLGFLYTLVSLSYALYNFSSSSELSSNATSIDPIINSFGIALATTIVGIMLRIFFNQMRHDIVDVEIEARIELSNAATRLRTELDQITLDMNHFGRASKQSIAESLQTISKEATDAISQSARTFDGVAKNLGVRIDETLNDFAVNVKKLNSTSGDMVNAIETLLQRVENIEAPSNLITTKIAPAMEAIKEAGEAINKRASGDGKVLARLTATIENALASSSLLDKNVSELNAVAVKAQENMIALNKSTEISSDIYSTIQNTVTEAQRLTQEHAQTIAAINQSLSGTASALSSLVSSWQAEVDAAITHITEKTSIAKKAIGQSSNDIRDQEILAMKELAASAETIFDTIRNYSAELEKELAKSRKSTTQIHTGLNEIIDEISTRLQL